MTPEEQNAVNIQQKTDSYLQRKLWAYKQRKQNVDTQYANQQEESMNIDTMNLYESWLQATDKEIKAQYNVASRWNLLAWMISDVAKEKGYDVTGPNGKSIFLPYTIAEKQGIYWSNRVSSSVCDLALALYFSNTEILASYDYDRQYGCCIRPVYP